MRNAVLSKSNNLVLYSNVSSIAEWFRNHSPMLENPMKYSEIATLVRWKQ
jgi:hypothetical protein